MAVGTHTCTGPYQRPCEARQQAATGNCLTCLRNAPLCCCSGHTPWQCPVGCGACTEALRKCMHAQTPEPAWSTSSSPHSSVSTALFPGCSGAGMVAAAAPGHRRRGRLHQQGQAGVGLSCFTVPHCCWAAPSMHAPAAARCLPAHLAGAVCSVFILAAPQESLPLARRSTQLKTLEGLGFVFQHAACTPMCSWGCMIHSNMRSSMHRGLVAETGCALGGSRAAAVLRRMSRK